MIAHALALGSAAISLLGLGLVMGTSPTLYAIVVRLLTTSRRPDTAIRWIALGVAIGTTVLLLAFRVVDPETLTAMITDRTEKLLVSRGVDLVAGLVLLALGLREASRLRRLRRPPKPKAPPTDLRPRRLILTGMANAMIGVSSMATMYVTGRLIASASHDLLIQLLLYAIFLVAVVGPYLLLARSWVRFPAMAHRITRVFDRLTTMDTRPLLTGGLLLAGLVFLALGVLGHGSL